MLVEEAQVEVQDPLADDVEAEVAGLDDAGVDRADRDLMGVVADDGHGPGRQVVGVVEQRPQRLVAGEAQTVEVVGLALVPARAGHEVDDRLDACAPRGTADQQHVACAA